MVIKFEPLPNSEMGSSNQVQDYTSRRVVALIFTRLQKSKLPPTHSFAEAMTSVLLYIELHRIVFRTIVIVGLCIGIGLG